MRDAIQGCFHRVKLSLLMGCVFGVQVACRPTDNIDAVVRRDSTGVEIVETYRESWSSGGGWEVRPNPQLVIGQVDGDAPYLFSGIVGVVRLDNGEIAVGDGQSREIRIFSPAGEFVRAVGGPGDGPSEIPQMLHRVERCGSDRLYALDILARGAVSYSV